MPTDEEDFIRFLKDTSSYFTFTTEQFKAFSPTQKSQLIRSYMVLRNDYYKQHDLSVKQKGAVFKFGRRL